MQNFFSVGLLALYKVDHIELIFICSFYLGHLPIILEATKDEASVYDQILKW